MVDKADKKKHRFSNIIFLAIYMLKNRSFMLYINF